MPSVIALGAGGIRREKDREVIAAALRRHRAEVREHGMCAKSDNHQVGWESGELPMRELQSKRRQKHMAARGHRVRGIYLECSLEYQQKHLTSISA